MLPGLINKAPERRHRVPVRLRLLANLSINNILIFLLKTVARAMTVMIVIINFIIRPRLEINPRQTLPF